MMMSTNKATAAATNTNNNKRVVTIDLISDTVWPWCFVGKRRLETALARIDKNANYEIDVRWRPFQLNDGLPKGKGVNKMEMYDQKFGADKIAAMIPRMKQVGAECGIDFSYGGNIGNTFDSHRFIWKAREVGGSDLQDKMVEALFEAYFEKEQSLGDTGVLEACANKAGVPTEVTQALLDDETMGKAEVEKELKEMRTKWNCRGVPLFVIDNQYQLSGAQPPEEFEAIFQEILDGDDDE